MGSLCCHNFSQGVFGAPCNKPRLYIGLYARGGPPKMPGKEDTYHWALLSGPKTTGDHSYAQIMYHVKEKLQVDGSDHEPASVRSYWEYSAEHDRTPMLLIRIVVAKITNLRRLQAILRAVPILADKEDWNGVSWVQEALRLASEDNQALGTRVEDWAAIRDEAMRYVGEKKHGHRFDGLGDFDVSKPATWDMLQAKELQV